MTTANQAPTGQASQDVVPISASRIYYAANIAALLIELETTIQILKQIKPTEKRGEITITIETGEPNMGVEISIPMRVEVSINLLRFWSTALASELAGRLKLRLVSDPEDPVRMLLPNHPGI